MKKHLAIFDLDGTLFDTNEVNYAAYRQALAESGFALDHDHFCRFCNGRHYTQFLPPIIGDDKALLKRVHERKKELYPTFLDRAVPHEHLFRIIEAMRDRYHLAVVTTASRANTLQILDYFQKTALFDLVLTQDDITVPKPDPQGFQRAMEHFGVDPQDAIIFEDSDVGVEAGLRSGARVVKIAN